MSETTKCSHCGEDIHDGAERWTIARPNKADQVMHADCGDSYDEDERQAMGDETWTRS